MGQYESLLRKGDIPVRLEADWDYSGIFGCVVLSTGNVMITDYNNHKVKVVDVDSRQIISTIMLTSGPSDVTTIENTRAAVTLGDERKIQLLHVVQRDTWISMAHKIRVDGKCIGIDYYYNRFIVSFLDPPRVQLINTDGIVLRNIQRDHRGFFLFERPLSVYWSKDRIHFYCSDAGKNEVMKIHAADGIVEAVNHDIIRPNGVIELPDDNLLVVSCDTETRWTNAVHHLGPDLRFQKPIISSLDGISLPRALCLRQKGNKLFDLIVSNRSGTVLSEYRMTFK